ncbi:phosphotransferase [Clostridium ganghwense]|uniref:Phosphotransferase n=1 Tax=Clostridium ganghwense TaxID=312089 RepID=A0ABT4CM21_9CLOT|nr:phosphotransferase [Clostridium ganghwense]MCY6369044.1 phosphotransferase [Clostridium ganghwense]
MNMNTAVENLMINIMKQKPIKIDRMNLGFINMVYNVKLNDNEVIVRINNNSEIFQGLEGNLNRLKEIGVPVPRLLYSDLSKDKYDFAYTILEKIPGYDLRYEIENMSLDEMTDIAEKVVMYQKKVGRLFLGKGFGRCNIGERGKYNSWTEVLDNELIKLKPNIDKVMDLKYSSKIVELFNNYKEYFNGIESKCFLDDISLKNVIINNGKLQGFIDFDWVCYGDPLYNVALVQTGTMLHLQPKCMHYVKELCREWKITDYEKIIIDFYSIIYAADFLGFQLKRNNTGLISKLTDIIKVLLQRIQQV